MTTTKLISNTNFRLSFTGYQGRIIYIFVVLAFISCLKISARATDKEYTLLDLFYKEEINGEMQYGLKIDILDHFLAEFSRHAGFYPPSFDNVKQRTKVEKELKDFIETLRIIYAQGNNNPELLWRYGKALSIGHNLDFPNSDEEAIKVFENGLTLYPDNLMLNYHYGVFLSSTSLLNQKSIPYFKKAIQLGMKEVKFNLAMVYISNEQTVKEGEKILIEYIKDFPADITAQKMLRAIQDGNIIHHFHYNITYH